MLQACVWACEVGLVVLGLLLSLLVLVGANPLLKHSGRKSGRHKKKRHALLSQAPTTGS